MRATTKYLVGALAVLAVIAAGYYIFFVRQPGNPRVYATEGIVLFQGKPAVGALVTLYPPDKGGTAFLPSGVVGEDGTFKLTTYTLNDGAPAGRYRVGIKRSWLDGDEKNALKKKLTDEEFEQIMAEKSQDPLYSKYANSDLTAVIPAPGNLLRFELD